MPPSIVQGVSGDAGVPREIEVKVSKFGLSHIYLWIRPPGSSGGYDIRVPWPELRKALIEQGFITDDSA